MAIAKCKICGNSFYIKPAHIKAGWGIFCSRECKHVGTRIRKPVNCFICNRLVYKTQSQINRSKSGKSFCGKSCQTKWRNVLYSGHKHLGWKGGRSTYRKVMLKSKKETQCILCKKEDFRVLVVHHVDQNHSNFDVTNLVWLCHNCHFLAHHDKLAKQRLPSILKA